MTSIHILPQSTIKTKSGSKKIIPERLNGFHYACLSALAVSPRRNKTRKTKTITVIMLIMLCVPLAYTSDVIIDLPFFSVFCLVWQTHQYHASNKAFMDMFRLICEHNRTQYNIHRIRSPSAVLHRFFIASKLPSSAIFSHHSHTHHIKITIFLK